MIRVKASSGKCRFGLVLGFVVAVSFGPAHAQLKIDPYPKTLMPFAKAQPKKTDSTSETPLAPVLRSGSAVSQSISTPEVEPGHVHTPNCEHNVAKLDRLVTEVDGRRKIFGDPGEIELTQLEKISSRPRRFTPTPSSKALEVPYFGDQEVALPVPSASNESVVPSSSNKKSIRSEFSSVVNRSRMATLDAAKPQPDVRDIPKVSRVVARARRPFSELQLPDSNAADVAPRWAALEGANVKDTLDLWSAQAGVDFVWDGSHRSFDVLRTATFDGSYEDAVRTLLDQYSESYIRPLGRLFVSPSNGRRVLVVEIGEGV